MCGRIKYRCFFIDISAHTSLMILSVHTLLLHFSFEVEISGFFVNSVVSHDVFLEAALGEDVLLKQTCERACDVLLEWMLERVCDAWKEYKWNPINNERSFLPCNT
jgi:hypothetical protein